jgi:hypothetical protein
VHKKDVSSLDGTSVMRINNRTYQPADSSSERVLNRVRSGDLAKATCERAEMFSLSRDVRCTAS